MQPDDFAFVRCHLLTNNCWTEPRSAPAGSLRILQPMGDPNGNIGGLVFRQQSDFIILCDTRCPFYHNPVLGALIYVKDRYLICFA